MSALITTQSTELVNPLLRVRCGSCRVEVSFPSDLPNADALFQSLLEKKGWYLFPKIRCPKCVNKKARKFLEEL